MDLEQFLEYISQIESSKGKNIAHKTMQHGMHAGEAAMGRYGIMPNTAREMYNRRRTEGRSTPDEDEIPTMNSEQMNLKFFTNPELEKSYAEEVAKHVLQRAQDPDKAAYMYTMGHNMNPEKISPQKMQKSDYVQKFQRLRNMTANNLNRFINNE